MPVWLKLMRSLARPSRWSLPALLVLWLLGNGGPPVAHAEPQPPARSETEPGSTSPAPMPEAPTGAAAQFAEFDLLSLEQSLEAVVVSATKQEQRVEEAPSIVTVVSAEEMKSYGYESVADALRDTLGFYVVDDQFMPSAGVRGVMGGMRGWSKVLKVLIDGQPAGFRHSSTNFLDGTLVPVELVERIEIIRGPASALYGENAFLGVVNVVTRDGRGLGGEGVTLQGGTYGARGLAGFGAWAGGTVGPVDVVLGLHGGRLDKSGLTLPDSSPARPELLARTTVSSPLDASAGDRGQPLSAFAKARWDAGRFGRLELTQSFQHVDAGAEFQDWSPLTHDNVVALNNLMTTVAWSLVAGERWDLNATAGFARGGPQQDSRVLGALRGEHIVGSPTGTVWQREFSSNELRASAEARYRLKGLDLAFLDGEQSSLLVGVDAAQSEEQGLRLVAVDDSGAPLLDALGHPTTRCGYNEPETFRKVGGYGQAVLYPLRSLGLTANYRFDSHNQYDSASSARLGAVFRVASPLYVKALFGNAFKAPAAEQLRTCHLTQNGLTDAPDLRPERATTGELMISLRPAPVLDKRLTVAADVAVFVNRIEDKVEITCSGETCLNVKPVNEVPVQSYGVETELRLLYGRADLYARAAWQRSERQLEGASKSYRTRWAGYSESLDRTTDSFPALQLMAGLRWGRTDQAGWHASLQARGASARKATMYNIDLAQRYYEVPGYALFDAHAGYTFTDVAGGLVRLGLDVDNALDTRYVEPGYAGIDYPGVPRLVRASVQFQH